MKRAIPASLALLLIGLCADRADAYDQYSVNKDATNCRACHGDFQASYTSLVDGQAWGSLHDVHRVQMLAGDCSTCHSAGPKFPVIIKSSAGGSGLAPIGCLGCHGRADDNTAANPSFPGMPGWGAGLRQHHQLNGVAVCLNCHADADPAAYTPVGEDVLPDYYQSPGNNHPNMPSSSCNVNGAEDYAGAPTSLDNDGDGVVDGSDPDCGGGTGGGGTGGAGTGGGGTGGAGAGGGGTGGGGTGGNGTGGNGTGGAGTGGAGTGGAGTGGAGGGTGGAGTGGAGTGGAGTGGAGTGGAGGGTGGAGGSGTGGGASSSGASSSGASSSGASGGGGSGASGGNAPANDSSDDGGCGCRLEATGSTSPAALSLGLVALGLAAARRRRSARPSGA